MIRADLIGIQFHLIEDNLKFLSGAELEEVKGAYLEKIFDKVLVTDLVRGIADKHVTGDIVTVLSIATFDDFITLLDNVSEEMEDDIYSCFSNDAETFFISSYLS